MLYALKIKSSAHLGNIFLILLLIFMGMTLNAQQDEKKDKKEIAELKRKATDHYKRNEVYEAIYYYAKYVDKEKDDHKSKYRLATLYYQIRDYQNAYDMFDTIIKLDVKKTEMAYYYKGLVSMSLEKYEEAIEDFKVFRRVYRGKKNADQFRKRAYDLIESSEWAILHKDSLADLTIHNLGDDINGPHIEFAPFPVDENNIIYGSLVPDKTSENDPEVRKVYMAERVDGQWKSKGLYSEMLDHPVYHTGNAALSLDGERIYFTQCKLNWQNKEICEIYMSEKIDGRWNEPVKLPYPVNDPTYTSTQPTVGINARKGTDRVYFVSDRKGTKGGLDIWYTEYNKRSDSYIEPKNLGRRINSNGDDCCPFFDEHTGSLYFSSNGRTGFGGFDIYRSVGVGRKWLEGEPLPKPLNSSFDETYFSTINGSEGFLTSNRPGSNPMTNGSCCEDIFYYKYNECVMLPATGKVYNITNSDIYEMLNHKYNQNLDYIDDDAPLSDIPVKLYIIDSENNEELLVRQTETDENGKYNFNLERNRKYVIVVENYGYFDKRISISSGDYNCDEVIEINETGINYLPEITVRFNIYYEHDKARLTTDAKTAIDTTLLPLFDLYPNALVEIGSHTDNTGSDNYNIKLSQRRSESVVNYLIRQGIDEERLVAKGYGESQPIASNENEDGTDNPEGRQLNRRTEFKIIGSLNAFYNEDDEEN